MSTAYDDSFKTLLHKCPGFILAVLNAMFGEHYSGDEHISFRETEFSLPSHEGRRKKRFTDSNFVIVSGKRPRKYHLECQTRPDGNILARIVEYDTLISIDSNRRKGFSMTLDFPHTGVLLLRTYKTTPDKMAVTFRTPGGNISYDIPIMKIQNYGIAEIFEKKLYFLLPFYIFNHEKRFKEYAKHDAKLEALREEYAEIKRQLDAACDDRKFTTAEYNIICETAQAIMEQLTQKYPRIREGVDRFMGGRVITYPSEIRLKKALNKARNEGHEEGFEEGIEKGREEGREEGRQLTLIANIKNLMNRVKFTIQQAMDALDIPEAERPQYAASIAAQG